MPPPDWDVDLARPGFEDDGGWSCPRRTVPTTRRVDESVVKREIP